MKLEILGDISVGDQRHLPGDQAEYGDEIANRLIQRGLARCIDEPGPYSGGKPSHKKKKKAK